MRDKGNHPCLSEDWLLDNLPQGWTYDCHMGNDGFGFLIYASGSQDPDPLFIPLDFLKSPEEVARFRSQPMGVALGSV